MPYPCQESESGHVFALGIYREICLVIATDLCDPDFVFETGFVFESVIGLCDPCLLYLCLAHACLETGYVSVYF